MDLLKKRRDFRNSRKDETQNMGEVVFSSFLLYLLKVLGCMGRKEFDIDIFTDTICDLKKDAYCFGELNKLFYEFNYSTDNNKNHSSLLEKTMTNFEHSDITSINYPQLCTFSYLGEESKLEEIERIVEEFNLLKCIRSSKIKLEIDEFRNIAVFFIEQYDYRLEQKTN